MSADGSEVVRLEQRKPFTMIDNPIIRAVDDYVALGLYVDMLSRPPGWRINLRDLARSHKQGRTVLTAAMNDLMQRGLVFRVRYQQLGGQWMTRTYVCSSPVTAAELLEIRASFTGHCQIETSDTLTEQANPARTKSASLTAPADPTTGVSPSTRFPAPGEPGVGVPDVGRATPGPPGVGLRGTQRSDSSPKIPPPNPPRSEERQTNQRRRGQSRRDLSDTPQGAGLLVPMDPGLAGALQQAYPDLPLQALVDLAPDLDAATTLIGLDRLVHHLASNTAGVKNPAAIIRTRLRNLPAGRTATPLPPWCGTCSSPTYRWIENADGYPVSPCPTCSAQAQAGHGVNHLPAQRAG